MMFESLAFLLNYLLVALIEWDWLYLWNITMVNSMQVAQFQKTIRDQTQKSL
jgi:hypothetical protein